jgi:hypothetical protein
MTLQFLTILTKLFQLTFRTGSQTYFLKEVNFGRQKNLYRRKHIQIPVAEISVIRPCIIEIK